MANLTFDLLPSATGLSADDLLALLNDPAGTPETQKATLAQLATFLAAVTEALTNKTIVAASNTITDTSAAANDLLVHNGTRFVRFATSATKVLVTDGAGAISWASVNLASQVTGTLPIANGGTGVASLPGSSGEALYNNAGALGSATNVKLGSGFYSVGATPATTGAGRYTNAEYLFWRNAANSANVQILGLDASNVINVGDVTNAVGCDTKTTTSIRSYTTTHQWRNTAGTSIWQQINASGVGIYLTTNLGLHGNSASFPDVASGVGVFGIGNCNTAPSGTPTGGGVLYSTGGAGTWKGSSATVTTFGPAEPHCPRCGTDVGIAYAYNDLFGEELIHCRACEIRHGNGVVLHVTNFFERRAV